MNHKKQLPFSNLDRDAWRHLGYLAIAVLYLLNTVFSLTKYGLFNGVGGDFFPFLTAGKVADLYGFAEMYNVERVEYVQSMLLSQLEIELSSFEPHPSPYFPVFMAPFKYLSRFDMAASFWVWSIITLILLLAYLYSFVKRLDRIIGNQPVHLSLLIPLIISYPVYTSFLYGQPEVFLLIFTGEFLLHSYTKKPFISGLWLGMLFLKPQVLLLVIPALLLQRNWKTLAGFFITAGSITLLSTLIVGLDGMIDLMKLWFAYAPNTEFFSPNGMANWRMLASNLNGWTGTTIGWIIAGAGMVITGLIWFKLSLRSFPEGSDAWIINVGAIFSTSLAFTWHSHIHMGMVLIPFLIFLLLVDQRTGKRAIDYWVFTFPAVMILSYLLLALIKVGSGQPDLLTSIGGFTLGLTGLSLYMLFSYHVLKNPGTQDQ